MLRKAALLVLLLCALLAGAQCDDRERLETEPPEEACRQFVKCWYPGESGTVFSSASPRWASMVDPRTENNIRGAYGPDGNCWYVDPSAGQVIDGAVIAEDAQAVTCGQACACTILELCAARADASDPAPACGPDVPNDPCTDGTDYDSMCAGT